MDDWLSKEWADHHAQFNTDVSDGVAKVASGLRQLMATARSRWHALFAQEGIRLPSLTMNFALFLLLCAIWGSTWIGIKAGLASVPPLMLAGTRFTAAGAVLLVWARARHGWGVQRDDLSRLLATSVLLVAACYGLMFWGMMRVDSGTAAVLEMGLTPVALLGFGLALGEEALSSRKVAAILMGVAGLAVLFGPSAAEAWAGRTGAGARVAGAGAVAAAALAYGGGSVIARPLLRRYPTVLIAGATMLLGGLLLVLISLTSEAGASNALYGHWGIAAWAGWLFLVLGGSIVGTVVFMRLLRDLGPVRAGSYAFVSPVVAVVLGAVVLGERVTTVSIGGMIVLLVAAGLALGDERNSPAHATAAERRVDC